jgi:hypothetical protein
MRVIATTVVRESIKGKQKTGWIYDVDWASGRVAYKLPVPDPLFPESDDNPRGGVRGGRGVAVTRDGIVVANYDTLYRYDDDWNVVSSFSHQLLVGTHEIEWDGDHLWVSATGIDAVLKLTLEGEVEVAWDPHAPEIAASLGIWTRPHALDGSVDYRRREAPLLDNCHINGVSRRNGGTIVNCGLVRQPKPKLVKTRERLVRKLGRELPAWLEWTPKRPPRSLVVRLNGTADAEILVELGSDGFPSHNGQLLDEHRVVVNDSSNNRLRVFRIDDGREERSVAIPGTWLRGLEPISPTHVLVGSAPATICLVDPESGSIEEQIQLSDNPNEAVHGLTLCPPSDARR